MIHVPASIGNSHGHRRATGVFPFFVLENVYTINMNSFSIFTKEEDFAKFNLERNAF